MDVKGITWVGNIYQKFEAMCLEVEEIMYQDTVKFVENQVQTVGANVKKFYSEVVEDLLPPSCIEPGKGTAPDFTVVKCNDIQMCKKSKVCRKREPAMAKSNTYPLSEDSKLLGDVKKGVLHALPFRATTYADNPCQMPSRGVPTLSEASLDLHSGNKDDKTVPELNTSVKKNISVEIIPSSESSDVNASGELRFAGFLTENDESADRQNITTSSGKVENVKNDSIEECAHGTENRSARTLDSQGDATPSEMLIMDECVADCEREMEVFHSFGVPLAKSYENCWNMEAVSEGASSMNGEISSHRLASEGGFVSLPEYSDASHMNAVEGDFRTDLKASTCDEPDKIKLEESCIMVSNDEAHFAAQREGKHRSYKKKFRDAFSSKKKLSRTREYKQLALLHGDDAEPNKSGTPRPGPILNLREKERPQAQDVSESEWELL